MNTEALLEKKKACNISNKQLAESLGIDQSTLWIKLNGSNKGFSLNEAEIMKNLFHLSDEEAVAIFL